MNVTFINARFRGGRIGNLRARGSRIPAGDGDPQPAHTRKFYRHARDWIAEIGARRRTDSRFEAGVSVARDERLLVGGIKNLLSGVTTVAHHDPLYPCLTDSGYPVHVVRDYGWSHSLYIDGEQSVVESYRATPADWPSIRHAPEGQNE